MKKTLVCISLALCYSCNKPVETYYALFQEFPSLYGKIFVYFEQQIIGSSTGHIQQKNSEVFVLPINIDKDFCRLIRTNTFFVAINGAIEMRICPDRSARELPPGASIKSFKSEWEYQYFLMGWKSTRWMQKLQNNLPLLQNYSVPAQ